LMFLSNPLRRTAMEQHENYLETSSS
jgi:hypothetical protein